MWCPVLVTPGYMPVYAFEDPSTFLIFTELKWERGQNRKVDNLYVPTTPSLGPHGTT